MKDLEAKLLTKCEESENSKLEEIRLQKDVSSFRDNLPGLLFKLHFVIEQKALLTKQLV